MILMHLQNNLKEREEEWEGTKEERGRDETGKEGEGGKGESREDWAVWILSFELF